LENRKTLKRGMSQLVYYPATASSEWAQPTETYHYDARGNLVEIETAKDKNTTLRTWYDYDGLNRKIAQIDPTGALTVWHYGGRAQALVELRYGAPVALPADGSHPTTTPIDSNNVRTTNYDYDVRERLIAATIRNASVGQMTATGMQTTLQDLLEQNNYDANGNLLQHIDSNNRATIYVYDAINRNIFTFTPSGSTNGVLNYAVTENIYDSAGNIAQTIRYANAVTQTSGDVAVIRATLLQASVNDQRSIFVYDRNNRLNFSFDALGALSEYQYDARGNKTLITQYAHIALGNLGYSTTQTVSAIQLRARLLDSDIAALQIDDHSTRYIYDASNRLTDSISAMGAVVHYDYDGLDRIVKQTAYATQVGGAFGDVSSMPIDSVNDRVTRYFFDAPGNLAIVVDARGYATERSLDLLGNVTKTVQHADPVILGDGLSFSAAQTQIWALGISPAKDRVTYQYYDNASRVILSVDALKYAKTYEYNIYGETIKTTQWATVTNASFNASTRLPVLTPSSTYDQIKTWTYDAAGRMTAAIDGDLSSNANAPQKTFIHDALGNVIASVNEVGGRSFYVYDAAARMTRSLTQVDASWSGSGTNRLYIVDQNYDVFGNLIGKTRYAQGSYVALQNIYTAFTPPTMLNMADEVIAQVFDRDNRLVRVIAKIDASHNTTTQYDYDAYGNKIRIVNAAGSADQTVTENQYDDSNRLFDIKLGVGTAETTETYYIYNAFAEVSYVIDPRGWELAQRDTAWATAWRSAHGFPTYVANFTNGEFWTLLSYYATNMEYDRAGNLILKREPSWSQDADITTAENIHFAATHSVYDGFNNLIQNTDANGNKHNFFYDQRGLLRYDVDALGFANEYWYFSDRQIAGKYHYASSLLSTYTATAYDSTLAVNNYQSIAALASSIWNTATDQRTTYSYNSRGLIAQIKYQHYTTSGAVNHYYESFEYDGLGDKTKFTDRNGNIYDYQYDTSGRLILERKPAVDVVTAVSATATTLQSLRIETAYYYDGLDRLLVVYEAQNVPGQARTTEHIYDSSSREITTIYRDAGVWNGAATVVQNILATKTYDARGNVIQEVDALGGRTQYYYDALNRRIAAVDAENYLRTYKYDAVGNLIEERTYGAKLTNAQVVAGAVPSTTAMDSANNYRIMRYTYDARNHCIASATGAVLQFDLLSNLHTGAITQQFIYDATGRIIRQIDGNGNITHHFYNAAGDEVLAINALGYAVANEYAQGNSLVTREIQFAGKPTDTTAFNNALAARDAQALIALYHAVDNVMVFGISKNYSRVTRYVYDQLGRVIEQIREQLYFSSASVSANGNTATVISQTADMPTQYEMDGLGNITKIRESVGKNSNGTFQFEVTDIAYDALGQRIGVQGAQFTDSLNQIVRQTTTFKYNAFGQVSEQIAVMAETGIGTLGSQTSRTAYDNYGRVKASWDAMGNATSYAYDKAGRVVYRDESIKDAYDTVGSIQTSFSYDKLGREISRGVLPVNIWYSTQYNAYGEIIVKGNFFSSTYANKEYFHYDAAGRLLRTDAESGVCRVYLYDANGNQTLEIRAGQSNALDQNTDLSTLSGWKPGDYQFFVSVYDAVDQQIAYIEPPKNAALFLNSGASATANQLAYFNTLKNYHLAATSGVRSVGGANNAIAYRGMTYSGFGQIVKQFESRDNYQTTAFVTTTFDYNELGQQVTKFSPTANTVAFNGNAGSATYTERNSYDAKGQLIAKWNSNIATYSEINYYAAGHLIKKFTINGAGVNNSNYGSTTYEYDRIGNLRTETTEIDFISSNTLTTNYWYNRNNQLTQQTRTLANGPIGSPASVGDSYTYDARGRRIRHTNALGGIERFSYDALDRIVSYVDADGYEISYSYDYDPATGGFIKFTNSVGGYQASETVDYFGRVTAKTDFGGHTTQYFYRASGALDHEIISSYTFRWYSYFDNMKTSAVVEKLFNTSVTKQANYDYDLNGNRMQETYAAYDYATDGTWKTLQNTTAGYDILNRLVLVYDANFTLAYGYDAAGNKTLFHEIFGTKDQIFHYSYDDANHIEQINTL
jgi:YD repeat-containing protein